MEMITNLKYEEMNIHGSDEHRKLASGLGEEDEEIIAKSQILTDPSSKIPASNFALLSPSFEMLRNFVPIHIPYL